MPSISCLVKGIKFYDGIGGFSSFDNVMLVREPSNPFDINSVLVILASKNREVLGHLERSVAAGIAELMDNFKFQVKIVGYVKMCDKKLLKALFSLHQLQYLHFWKNNFL